MSIMTYNGGAVIGMTGKDCVAIGSDLRFGIQNVTMATDMPKVFKVNDQLFVGFSGLATDIQTVRAQLRFDVNLYKLKEEREIKPSTFSHMLSATLYEKRFGPYFVEPVIAGLDNGKPWVSSMDVIGCEMFTNDFCVTGSMTQALYGVCESMWKKDMSADALFETVSQCLLNGMDRDAIAGWGAVVHVISKDKIVTKYLKARQD